MRYPSKHADNVRDVMSEQADDVMLVIIIMSEHADDVRYVMSEHAAT